MEQNKKLIESYKLTTVRDRIGIYGQRLILRLVEHATSEGATQGLDFKSGRDIRRIEVGDWGRKVITMPLKDIMGSSENYSAVKRAVKALQQEIIEYEVDNGTWVSFQFLGKCMISAGQMTVTVEPELWEALMDFRKGFRRFELQAALKLKSTYSLRLYKLVSEQNDINYLDFQLIELKKMLGVGNKYKQSRDFFVKVLDPAKEELDKISPWSFTYTPLTSRKVATGRAAIVGVRIFPVSQPQFRDPEVEKNRLRQQYPGALSPSLTREQKNILIHKFDLTNTGILNNKDLFDAAAKYLDMTSFLLDLAKRVAKVRPVNVPGYVINAIRMELAAQGVDV